MEEALTPPVIWEKERGWFTTEPFSEPETFTFPAGIGPVECVNVEHEEVLLMPRWVGARRGTVQYRPGSEVICRLPTPHRARPDSPHPGAGGRAPAAAPDRGFARPA